MSTDDDRPAIHQGLTDLLELKSGMLQTVLGWLSLVVAIPLVLYFVVIAARFVWYVVGRIMP